MKTNRIFFRADGGSKTGLGHIMRCLSLSEWLKAKFSCFFVLNDPDPSIKRMVERICPVVLINCDDKRQELNALKGILISSDIVVTDGYSFDTQYQLELKAMIHKLVMIDDEAKFFYHADVIINHGGLVEIPPYRTAAGTQVYSGFEFLIARKEFLVAAKIPPKKVNAITTVFICMGGADPFNITIKVLQACLQCAFLQKIIIVTGSVYINKNALQSLIFSVKNITIEHVENADASEMMSCIHQSQISVSTASSVSLEICCVKSALLCGTVIDNQYAIHSQLIRNGCCISIGDWNSNTVDDIKKQLERLNDLTLVQGIINAQARCVDGRSGERIMKIFNELVA